MQRPMRMRAKSAQGHPPRMTSRTTTLRPLQVASDSVPQTLRLPRVYPLGETCQFDASIGLSSVVVPSNSENDAPKYQDSVLGKAGIAQQEFVAVVHHINAKLAEIDVPSWTCFLETIFGCLTCYVFEGYMAKRTRLRRGLREIRDFVKVKNSELFNPNGVNLTDPKETAWQFLEFESTR